ncbi:family 7 glycoside hydrolase [Cryphonectria parasitica EP155]|uniref:Glucanase n=1 Tax=Cryphonectria parasitica (strain ATCC 38755 / EP155) TaxID=660469 RepID=A0A9P5CSM6_CRYP1|nr:family 7 glycoside hydrolase [Cryphonectria parasitica EP155]KAF3769759.1 family 7 glycoside hydrolase [Cryphonectria parasitica EP155]
MTLFKQLLPAALLPALAACQQIGTAVPEVHPKLPTYRCTNQGGCVQRDTTIVLDEFYRNIHDVNNTAISCGTYAALNTTLCPTAEACAENCALEGIDYAANGVQTDGDAIIMNQFIKLPNGTYDSVGPRVYLLDIGEEDYELFQMLDMEISFDVDLSKLVCGMNGALYLTEMEASGGRSALNPAGASYGTGYCDAQCSRLAWINGVANVNETHGSCCNEMDLLEANALAQAMTPHPCNTSGVYLCTSDDECGQADGVCDEWGCGWNPYVYNVTDFYGPAANDTIDTKRVFTVTTQFITDDGTPDGTLIEIRRLWGQDGRILKNAVVSTGDGFTGSVMDDAYCNATASWTQERGGLAGMGDALGRGMVLIFSIWDDTGGYMNWLDEGSAGPCNATEGNPALIEEYYPGVQVKFEKIRYGEIGSTF